MWLLAKDGTRNGIFSKLALISPLRRLLELGAIGRRDAAKLAALQVVAIAFESVGVASILPVLDFVEANGNVEALVQESRLWALLAQVFEYLGLDVSLAGLLLVTFSLICCRQVANYAVLIGVERAVQATQRRLAEGCFSAVMGSNALHIEEMGAGHFIDVAYQQAQVAAKLVQSYATLWRLGVTLAAYVVVMVTVAPAASLSALAVMLVALVSVDHLLKAVRAIARRRVSLQQQYSQHLSERFRAWKLIKLSNASAHEHELFALLAGRLYAVAVDLARTANKIEFFIVPIITAFAFGALYVTVEWFDVSLAVITVFLVMLLRLVPVAMGLTRARQSIANASGSLDRLVAAVQGAREAVERSDGRKICAPLKYGIQFQGVSFVYPSAEDPALRDVDLVLPGGRMTALMGESGAGKSTLVDIIPRLLTPAKGQVLWDDVPLQQFSLTSLRSQIAYVPQMPLLFDATVTENVRFARKDASMEEVEEACRQAYADEFIRSLPAGFDTPLGEDGAMLSGGQRQRLVLARAFLQQASLLILDEPTSALDDESEQRIKAAIKYVIETKRMTVVVIAHRWSTVQNADYVVVLQRGRVVEAGEPGEGTQWARSLLAGA